MGLSSFRGRGGEGGCGRGKVAFLFPGQGSQYVNMCLGLYQTNPTVRATFDEADQVLLPLLGCTLSSLVFAPPGAHEATLARAATRLGETRITQPAVLTCSIALYRCFLDHGIVPDHVAGHSLGEYGALIAAGVLSFKEALSLVWERGRLMEEASPDDKGKMAFVRAGQGAVEQGLGEIDGYVVCANFNSPLQTVVSGASGAVEQAVALFRRKKIMARELDVSQGFHSRLVDGASSPFRDLLARIPVKGARIPVTSNVDGSFYPVDDSPGSRQAAVNLMVSQMTSPVQWIRQVEDLHTRGVDTYVEMGPGNVLSRLVEGIMGPGNHKIYYTNHPDGDGVGQLNKVVNALKIAGAGVWGTGQPGGGGSGRVFEPGGLRPLEDAQLFVVDLEQIRVEIAEKREQAGGSAPPGHEYASWEAHLTSGELAQLREFKFDKRRVEWLGGRLAVKEAVRALLAGRSPRHESGPPLPNRIQVVNRDDTRAPLVLVDGRTVPGLEISITHSNRFAMGAAVWGRPIGIDLELVAEPIIDVSMIFAPEELERINGGHYGFLTRTQAIIVHWSLKEAVSKHCKLGFHMDFTRLVVSSLVQSGEATVVNGATNTPYPCRYHCNQEYVLAHTSPEESQGLEHGHGELGWGR